VQHAIGVTDLPVKINAAPRTIRRIRATTMPAVVQETLIPMILVDKTGMARAMATTATMFKSQASSVR